jgi:hypothetical protein
MLCVGEVRPGPQVHSRHDGIHDGSEFPPLMDNADNQAIHAVTPTCAIHGAVGAAVLLQGEVAEFFSR